MNTDVRITEIVARGSWGTVECAVRQSGEIPAKDFLANELQGEACARFMHLFQQMADYGRISPKRFKSEMGKLFAFSFTAAV